MRRAALVLVLAASLAGCTQGGGTGVATSDFSGNERDVADAISDFSEHATSGEESKACTESLSGALREKVAEGGDDCPDELGKAFDDADPGGLEIDDVSVTGTDATAKVSVEDRDREVVSTWRLVDEAGDWRIDSFGTTSRP